MNKIFLKMSLLTIIMMATRMNGSQLKSVMECSLIELEDPIYLQTNSFSVICNIHRLDAYAKYVERSLPQSNRFRELSNKIDETIL